MSAVSIVKIPARGDSRHEKQGYQAQVCCAAATAQIYRKAYNRTGQS